MTKGEQCGQKVMVKSGPFAYLTPCAGRLSDYGQGPDYMLYCPECGAVWSMDGKEE